MFTSALNLLNSDPAIDNVPKNVVSAYSKVQDIMVIDVSAIRLSPLATENEDAVLQFARFGYQLYLSGLFVHMISPSVLIVWVPTSMKEDFVMKLSKRFEVSFISTAQSIHWLKSALTRNLTLHNNSVIVLDCGVLFGEYSITLTLTTSTEFVNTMEATVIISIQLGKNEWRVCCWNDLEFELTNIVYVAPSFLAILPRYVEEESTQDEASEHLYLDGCLRWGYRLCETLLRLAYLSNDGDIVVFRVFPQMLLKKITLTQSTQISQSGVGTSDSSTATQLIKTCIEKWRCFSIELLDTIDISKCLLSCKPKRVPFKFTKIGSHNHYEEIPEAASIYSIKPIKTTLSKASFTTANKDSLERHRKVIKALTAQSSLCPKMRSLLDEIRRDLECKDASVPEPVKMKQVKATKRQLSSKSAVKLLPSDTDKKASSKDKKKSKKVKELSTTPILPNISKKSNRRVHFNTTVLFVDEWDKVHQIKLQQHESISYYHENDIQQDIESEFTTSLLS